MPSCVFWKFAAISPLIVLHSGIGDVKDEEQADRRSACSSSFTSPIPLCSTIKGLIAANFQKTHDGIAAHNPDEMPTLNDRQLIHVATGKQGQDIVQLLVGRDGVKLSQRNH